MIQKSGGRIKRVRKQEVRKHPSTSLGYEYGGWAGCWGSRNTVEATY